MERLTTAASFVGIDVSKDRLDVHVCPSGRAFATLRDVAGLAQLVNELRRDRPGADRA
jgi:transposase